MSCRWSSLCCAVLVLVLGSAHQLRSRQGTRAVEKSALTTKVYDFKIIHQTIFDAIAQLSSQSIGLNIGFEEILRPKFTDSALPSPRLTLDLKEATLRQLVETLCVADGRYTWSFDGRTINVFPEAVAGDPKYLLNRRIPDFRLESITSIEQGLFAISHQLPPPNEQIAISEIGGADAYSSQPWTTSFKNITVREAINELADHMGGRNQWLFYGARDFRAFAFFRAGFNPKHEAKTTQP